MGTGLLPSSDDSDNNFSRTLKSKNWGNNQSGLSLTRTVYAYLSSPTPILCLFKPRPHFCSLKVTEDGLKYLHCLFSWCVPSHVITLSFSMSLYLPYWGEWLDLTCGSSGVWALDVKLLFYSHYQDYIERELLQKYLAWWREID
jgi:hypothetical protein